MDVPTQFQGYLVWGHMKVEPTHPSQEKNQMVVICSRLGEFSVHHIVSDDGKTWEEVNGRYGGMPTLDDAFENFCDRLIQMKALNDRWA